MHSSFSVALLTLLHAHLVLGSFSLDPRASADGASEGARQLDVVEADRQHSSRSQLHPDSVNDQLQERVNLPLQVPSRTIPLEKSKCLEEPSTSGDSISSGSSQGRKRLAVEQLGFQPKLDGQIHQSASKKLKLSWVPRVKQEDLKIFLGPSDSKLKEPDAEGGMHLTETLQDISNEANHQDLSFKTWENSEEDVGKLIVLSPVNMEKVIRVFKPEGVNKDFWAWIWIISHYVSVETEIDQHVKTSLKILKPFYSIKNQCYQNPNPHTVEDPPFSNLQRNTILKLVTFLWCVNLRVLELLGAPQGSEDYFKEQVQFMKWFDWFMLFFSDKLKLDLSSIDEQNYHIEINTHGRFIYQKILQALDSISERELYILHLPKSNSRRFCSQERQYLLNQSAVHLLGFYYKNTNFKKWNYAFGGNDIDFIRKLEELGGNWEDRTKCDLPTDLRLLPWADPCTKNLPLLGPNNLKTTHFNFHKYVEAIPCSELRFDLTNFGKNKQFQISKGFFLNKSAWSIISSLKLIKQTKLMSEFKPSTKLLLSTQRIISEYIEEFSSSMENDISEKINLLKKLNYAELEVIFNDLLEFVWEINGKILQSMGSEVFEESFLKEQRLVQLFFEFFMDQGGGENSRNIAFSHGQSTNKDSQKKMFHKSIIKLLVMRDTNDRYTGTIEEYGTRKKITVLKKHNFMCQLALYVLGNYYKNENFESWNHIFVSDGTFLKFIQNISDPNKYSQYEEKLFPQLRSQGLIPWKK